MQHHLREKPTGLVVAGLGILLTGIGRMVGGKMGDNLSGFGIAHVMLGVLDTLRDKQQ